MEKMLSKLLLLHQVDVMLLLLQRMQALEGKG